MGVRITHDCVTLYCSTSMWAFGPVFEDADQAESFLQWANKHVGRDLRLLTDEDLSRVHSNWLSSTAECEICGDRTENCTSAPVLCNGCRGEEEEEEVS